MLQLAHRSFAARVVAIKLRNHLSGLGGALRHLGKQPLRFFGVVLAFGKLVDIEQHGPHHVEKRSGLVPGALAQHQPQRVQHCGQRGMLLTDGLQTGWRHGALPKVTQECKSATTCIEDA
ncbi:hypothetical protein D3C71_1565750 [compost metagenome]